MENSKLPAVILDDSKYLDAFAKTVNTRPLFLCSD